MPEQDRWQLELSEYIRQGEPERAEKSAAWQTAIGLQALDGLKTSSYLLETAKAHIEGDIDIAGAQRRIQSYYKEQANRKAVEDGTMEADIVSARITELLGEKTFQFSPAELQSIHRRLFTSVFDLAGQFRTYNITKNEWVLDGDTVVYSSWESIRDTLDYDFSQEKRFSYCFSIEYSQILQKDTSPLVFCVLCRYFDIVLCQQIFNRFIQQPAFRNSRLLRELIEKRNKLILQG